MKISPLLLIIAMIAVTFAGLLILIFGTEPPPNTVVQHPVETVEFIRDAEFNESDVFVKTDRENLIVDKNSLNFIRGGSGEALIIDEVKFGSPRSAFGVKPYSLRVPEDRIEEISEAYTKIFGEEIVFVGDEPTK